MFSIYVLPFFFLGGVGGGLGVMVFNVTIGELYPMKMELEKSCLRVVSQAVKEK
jgi:hypothetical protein